MSAYEYAQVNNFICRLYKKYGKGLEYEECRSIGFLEYVEARRQSGMYIIRNISGFMLRSVLLMHLVRRGV